MRVWFSTNAPTNGAWPGRKAISPLPRIRVMTCVASPVKSTFSGDTTLTGTFASLISGGTLLQALRLGEHLLDATDVQERLLGYFIQLPADDRLEALDCLGDGNGFAADTREHLGHVERLAEETLHLASTRDRESVLFGELVETEDGDDVLELLVPLQDLLNPSGDGIVALADDLRRQDRGGGGQRINGGIDAERGDLAAELGG